MLKQGIFLKIYFCFWMTIVLLVALNQIDKLRPLNVVMQRIESSLASSLDMYGQAALAYYQAGKPKTAKRLAEQFRQSTGIDAYLLDEAGNRMDGDPAPLDVEGMAARAARSGTLEHLRKKDMERLALSIASPDGKRFMVVASRNRKSFLPSPLGDNRRVTLRISILLVIAGLVCFLLTRYLVWPLIALREATRRFAEGDLSVRIGERMGGRKDEITELAHDFDGMAERIESLVKLQRQLLGDVSHELRSPLARLNVALDLARQKTGGEAEHALNRIEEEAQELNELIGELLTLTRLESGSARMETAPVDVTELLREIVRDGDFEAQGSNRGVRLIEYDQCVVSGDRELLRRAVENVVRNAIHHTDENTEVEIGITRRRSGKVRIAVRDHGPGLPESELGNIFRPFYRTSESRERQTGGTGLGLAICQRAIQLHHGTVAAENASGGGLLVTFSL